MFKWREGQQNAIHHTNIKRGITNNFARALKVLQQKHLQCREDEFVYSNDSSNNLCNSLEAAFLHGLKDSVVQKLTAYVGLTATPDQSTHTNFWNVVVKFAHSDVVTQLQHLTQISTDIGLCRAWVRLALNDGLMESYLHSMIVDTKTIKYFYHSHSFLRDHEQPGILKNYLTGLMSLEFKLSYNSSVLNYWNNSTLQLIGTLDTHYAPSPAIGQAGRAPADPVQQKSYQERDNKTENSTVSVKDITTISQGDTPATLSSIQDVENLSHTSATKNDHVSSLSLSVSEGSSGSHVSCPDPVFSEAREAKSPLETRPRDSPVVSPIVVSQVDVDNLSDKFPILPFQDIHDNYSEQNPWAGTDNTDMQKTDVHQSNDDIENCLRSHIIIEEASSLESAASPTRPRSRRVDEEDMKHVLSSSFYSSSPEKSNTTHSDIALPQENQDIVYIAATSPQREQTSSERSRGLNQAVIDKHHDVVLESLHRQVDPSSEDSKLEKKIVEEVSAFGYVDRKTEHEALLKKAEKDHDSQEKIKILEKDRTLDSVVVASKDLMIPDKNLQVVNHVSVPESSHMSQKNSQIPIYNNPTLHEVDKTIKSSVPSKKDKQTNIHLAHEETSAHSRIVDSIHGSNEHSHDIDQKYPSRHSHGSVFYPSVNIEHDPQVTEDAEANTVMNSNQIPQQDNEEINTELELSISPSRYGNSLNSMSGWSSEIESKRERRKQSVMEKNRAESFASMLRAYTPAFAQQANAVTVNDVIETLPCDAVSDISDEDQTSEAGSSTKNEENNQWEDPVLDNFEVLKSPSEFFCGQVEANSTRMFYLFHVPHEHGLSDQNFACKGCFRPIGIIYGPPRLCEFDGGLYCYGCHENNEAYIPSSILYDWDFRKKKVCQENYTFLHELEEQALYDVEELNPKLYSHVPELQELKLLREQLCYLKSYLFTCSQKVAESLRQKVWPKEHLYDRRDLFSVTDFLQVQSGSLHRLVKDLVKFSSQHVYDCVLCSLKGFVCEICRNPQVIYPFEVDTTVRCKNCKAVYHKTCMTDSLPCPKCERWSRHMSSGSINDDHPEDYGMSPHG